MIKLITNNNNALINNNCGRLQDLILLFKFPISTRNISSILQNICARTLKKFLQTFYVMIESNLRSFQFVGTVLL